MSQYSADGWTQYSDKKVKEYYTAGLTRTHTPFDSFVLGKGVNWNEYHDIQGKLSYIIQTVTLPINAALWAGASGSSLHNYTWQSNGSGDWNNRDATAAVKEVTKSACAKLKSDYSSNLRVYLIKFRKQEKYMHKVTNAETSFDYSYLNNCATGTSSPYMYDITTEAELKSALEAIYTNIKDWASRTEAKNV